MLVHSGRFVLPPWAHHRRYASLRLQKDAFGGVFHRYAGHRLDSLRRSCRSTFGCTSPVRIAISGTVSVRG